MDFLARFDGDTINILKSVGAIASAASMKAYLVGGPVRDLALGHPLLDVDIVIVGNGLAVAKKFAEANKAKITLYPAFKTATVILKSGQSVDFATARKETYAKPGAFPKVIPSGIEDDLFRRDFTINAIAIGINEAEWGKVVDPYEGLKDLKAKKIRVLHDGSFVDDPTRILRAARFKERFSFKMDAHTKDLLAEALKNRAMESITRQRYKKEHDKILKEKQPALAIACLEDWGVKERKSS